MELRDRGEVIRMRKAEARKVTWVTEAQKQ